MIGVSWNCCGLGNPRAVRALKDLDKARRPDFLFLMETLIHSNKIDEIKILLGYDGAFYVDREDCSGSPTFLWNNSCSCTIVGFSNNHIDVNFYGDDNISWRCTSFYGYPERNKLRDS